LVGKFHCIQLHFLTEIGVLESNTTYTFQSRLGRIQMVSFY